MPKPLKRTRSPIKNLLEVMSRLRAPDGCPWDREQDHASIRYHAVEEVYEMIDAIEAGDDHELEEELGDLLLQVVFHCQLARERDAFDFDAVARRITEKLVHRHPHVFGDTQVKDVDEVWANWEKLKHKEKEGTHLERPSALDGIPRHLPALQRTQKLAKKAAKAGLLELPTDIGGDRPSQARVRRQLFDLAAYAQARGWNAEELLRTESNRTEERLRQQESKRG
jgi:tetrapyrrole methylase family protein/MazG family protein